MADQKSSTIGQILKNAKIIQTAVYTKFYIYIPITKLSAVFFTTVQLKKLSVRKSFLSSKDIFGTVRLCLNRFQHKRQPIPTFFYILGFYFFLWIFFLFGFRCNCYNSPKFQTIRIVSLFGQFLPRIKRVHFYPG